MADEVHENRQYWMLDVEYCHFCPEVAAWRVYETTADLAEDMTVCNRHKFTAFS